MRKLRINWRKIWLPIILTLLAVASIGVALWIYREFPGDQLTKVREEIAKSLMNLGAGVIVGGLVKMLLDNFRNEQERSAARKAWAQDLLNRLRGVFDEIELSRTLIDSHRTAKTYGERIRGAVMPSNITLFEIKRSLVDSGQMMDHTKVLHFRVSIHYMLAYLQALIAEYQKRYSALSNHQFYQEGIRSALKKDFGDRVLAEYEPGMERESLQEKALTQKIPPQLSLVWSEFEKLPVVQDFLAAADSRYYRLFLDHYEYCKALLKSAGKPRQWPEVRPPNFEESYLRELKNIDQKKRDEQLQASDSLLLKILEEQME